MSQKSQERPFLDCGGLVPPNMPLKLGSFKSWGQRLVDASKALAMVVAFGFCLLLSRLVDLGKLLKRLLRRRP